MENPRFGLVHARLLAAHHPHPTGLGALTKKDAFLRDPEVQRMLLRNVQTPPALLDPRLLGLGGVFMLATLAVFVVYAWASASVRDRVLGAPAVRRWLQRSLGALLVGFAARLAVTDR